MSGWPAAWRRVTIRRRFTVVITAAVALVVVLVTLTAFLVARDSLRDQLDLGLRREFAQIARTVRQGDTPYVVTGPCRYQAAPACARVVTATGRTVVVDGIESDVPLPPGAAAVAAGRLPAFTTDVGLGGVTYRAYVAPLEAGRALVVAEQATDTENDIRDLQIALAVVGGLGLVLVAAVAMLVTRANLAPIRGLVAESRQIAERQDPGLRVDEQGRDELSGLARSFNLVLVQLEAALTAQRHLVADASHELRTPLTSLRANVDLLRQADRLSPAQQEATVAALDAQVRDLVTLVNALLDLARGEEADAHRELLRLDELVARCVRRARTHWPKVVFTTDLAPCLVEAAPLRLATAIGNVLDNASKFAGDAGPVEVVLRADRSGADLTVADRGPGIAAEDVGRVFDRFYRAAGARGRPGSGLGLAIAREVAEAHGGTITVLPGRSGAGTLLQFRFPAIPAGEPAREPIGVPRPPGSEELRPRLRP